MCSQPPKRRLGAGSFKTVSADAPFLAALISTLAPPKSSVSETPHPRDVLTGKRDKAVFSHSNQNALGARVELFAWASH
jgi:hypothetical protein